ncbi:Pau24p, partial [Saccharomyces cerevisiae YJM326]
MVKLTSIAAGVA